MKSTNVITLLLAAFAGALPLSTAQEQQAAGPMLQAVVQPKAAKGTKVAALRLAPPASISKTNFLYINPQEPAPVEASVKDFKLFVIMTPNDLASAIRAYAEDELSTAKRQLAAVRNKYSAYAGLPNNPSTRAAVLEMSCLARLMDWNALAKLVDSIPGGARVLDASDKVALEAAALLSRVSDDAAKGAELQKDVEAFLADSGKVSQLSSEGYTWLKYAQARAIAAGIPSAELHGTISAANAQRASLAVDAYCEAVAAAHGRYPELPLDAMKRAFNLLWAMPGVKEYAASAKDMDKKKWASAPHNFKDAVALAYLIAHVYAPDTKDAAISQAAAFHINTLIK